MSTLEQNLDLQRKALTNAECEILLADSMRGAITTRPGWKSPDTASSGRHPGPLATRSAGSIAQGSPRPGRLSGRTAGGLWSLHEAIDISRPAGKRMLHRFKALAEFKRNLMRERTQARLAATRTRRLPLDQEKRVRAVKLYQEGPLPALRHPGTSQAIRNPLHRNGRKIGV